MKVTLNSVKRLCSEAQFPPEFVEQHIDAFAFLVMRVAKWQMKKDANKIRGWWFDNNPAKGPLFEVLVDEEDEELME